MCNLLHPAIKIWSERGVIEVPYRTCTLDGNSPGICDPVLGVKSLRTITRKRLVLRASSLLCGRESDPGDQLFESGIGAKRFETREGPHEHDPAAPFVHGLL